MRNLEGRRRRLNQMLRKVQDWQRALEHRLPIQIVDSSGHAIYETPQDVRYPGVVAKVYAWNPDEEGSEP